MRKYRANLDRISDRSPTSGSVERESDPVITASEIGA
jgi:hypothetical protein